MTVINGGSNNNWVEASVNDGGNSYFSQENLFFDR